MTDYPRFPPGFWRRIILHPGSGWIGAALEDDMHCFLVRLDHAQGRISRASARALRHPWTGCAGAPDHLEQRLTGEKLAEVAGHDARLECTHLFDLAILCAAHAADTHETRFDMFVADRVDGRTTATLERDGTQRLHWRLRETEITGPAPFAGRDIKRVSQWKHDFPPDIAEQASLLRRAIFVSGARQYPTPVGVTAAQQGEMRQAVCFNYQPQQAVLSTPVFERRDFSGGECEPLDGLDVAGELAAMA